MTLDANKALIRRVFEEVIPAGDPSAMRDVMAPDFLDHDPLPGQPAGAAGGEYVVSTMHTAHPDLRFTIDDLVAEADRVTIRWTLRGTNTGPLLGRPPSGQPVELSAIVIFRIADRQDRRALGGLETGPLTAGPPRTRANRSRRRPTRTLSRPTSARPLGTRLTRGPRGPRRRVRLRHRLRAGTLSSRPSRAPS